MPTRNIKIRAAAGSAGEIEFDVDGTKPQQSRIALAKDSGIHKIHFQLKDQTGRDLQFDQGDPMWVGEDCDCPPPSGMNSDQLQVTDCSGPKLSTVNKKDGRARELRYQLNFIASDGSRFVCDPVIVNGGGGRS